MLRAHMAQEVPVKRPNTVNNGPTGSHKENRLPAFCPLFRGQHLYFNARTFRQILHGHSRTGRERLREESGIDLVHGGKVGHIGQIYRGFDDVCKVGTGFFQYISGVCEGLCGLFFDTSFDKVARFGVDLF